jgi:hypothetical protein
MKWKVFGRKRKLANTGTLPVFPWKPRKTVRREEIRIEDPSTNRPIINSQWEQTQYIFLTV